MSGSEQAASAHLPELCGTPDLSVLFAQFGRPIDDIGALTSAIHGRALEASRHIRQGDFEAFASEDLEQLFDLYDGALFNGLFRRLLARPGEGPLTFRISRTMTSAGAKTKSWHEPDFAGRPAGAPKGYEISVSAPLLFQTFHREERDVVVAGLPCADRLEALQRLMEHEMLHLLELLVWRQSSCSWPRFQTLAFRIFGHTASQHELVTQREVAHRDFGIQLGDRVAFEFEGRRYTGRVNRITKRVTVLVEDPDGARYSDGKHYLEFYVPLGALTPA